MNDFRVSQDTADLRQTEVFRTVTGRRSVRGFLPVPVEDSLIAAILDGAARAPSGQNMQPWQVHVVSGVTKAQLTEEVTAAAERGERSEEYRYLPDPIDEPYLSRRRKVGYDLYALYGIERSDMAERSRAYLRNFAFFGAPIGLFFVMDRAMALGSWIDCGAFMQNVMILARAAGLETCPQQAWCDHGNVVRRVLNIPDSQILVCGMAMGYIDLAVDANALRTDRVSSEEFAFRHS